MTAPESARPLRRWPLIALWIALSIALVSSFGALPWQSALEQLRGVHAIWAVVAVAANILILPLWAMEWRLLSPRSFRATFKSMFEVVSVTAAVLNSVPFFAGEAAGVGLLITRAGLSSAAALSLLAMDQLLVGFAKLAVVMAAAAAAPIPAWLRGGIVSTITLVALLFIVLLALAHRRADTRPQPVRPPSFGRRVMSRLASFGEYLEPLRESKRAWRVGLLALAKKALELSAIVAVQMAFGLAPSLPVALLVLAALAVTTLIPVTPANLGVYEATVFAAYRFAGASAELALGIAVIQHLFFLLPMLVTGYVMVTLRQFGARRTSAA